jgi:hypothetical protein
MSGRIPARSAAAATDRHHVMHMRRALLILPFVVPLLFHRLYQPVNEAWTVKRFGCGCPPVTDVDAFRFNANHFNMIIWLVIMFACGASWWLLLRPEFVTRRSTKYYVLQFVGVYVLLIICLRQFAREHWL